MSAQSALLTEEGKQRETEEVTRAMPKWRLPKWRLTERLPQERSGVGAPGFELPANVKQRLSLTPGSLDAMVISSFDVHRTMG